MIINAMPIIKCSLNDESKIFSSIKLLGNVGISLGQYFQMMHRGKLKCFLNHGHSFKKKNLQRSLEEMPDSHFLVEKCGQEVERTHPAVSVHLTPPEMTPLTYISHSESISW